MNHARATIRHALTTAVLAALVACPTSQPAPTPQPGPPPPVTITLNGDFNEASNTLPGVTVTSNAITVEGSGTATATVTGGIMRVSGQAPTASATVKPGDTIALTVTAGMDSEQVLEAKLEVGGVSKRFTVKTGKLGPPSSIVRQTVIPAAGLSVQDTTPTCPTVNSTGQALAGPGTQPDTTLYPAVRKVAPVTGNVSWWDPTGTTLLDQRTLPTYSSLLGGGFTWNNADPFANAPGYKNTWQICPPESQTTPGVTTVVFSTAATGKVGRIVLETTIQHGYRSDLKISLIAPSGKTAVVYDLFDQPGGEVVSSLDGGYDVATGLALKITDAATVDASNKTVNVDERCGRFVDPATTDRGNCWDNTRGGWQRLDIASTAPATVKSNGSSLTQLGGEPIGGTWTLRIEDRSPGNYEQDDGEWPINKGPKRFRSASVFVANLLVEPLLP